MYNSDSQTFLFYRFILEVGDFHHPLIRKQVLKGAYAVRKHFKMGLRKCEDTFCFVSLVSYELRYSTRLLSLLEQKCICALGVPNKFYNGTDK